MKRTKKLLFMLLAFVFMMGLLPTVAPIHAHAEPTGACPDCGAQNWQQTANSSTCTLAGETEWTCRNCGYYTYTTAPALGHSWSNWAVAAGSMPATCTQGTTEARTCSRCGASETRSVPALGHNFSRWTTTKEATCTEAGSRTAQCSNGCGQTQTETIPALGHSWDSGTVTKAATCEATGTRTYTCSRCGQTRTEAIPALGHDYVTEITRQPTCTEAGEQADTCSRCGDRKVTTLDPLGHDWDNGVTTEPEGLTDGETAVTCKRCGETETQIIPAAPSMFNMLRNVPPEALEDDALVIVTQPEGGLLPSGGVFTLNVEVAGGTPPYDYEWHRIGASLPNAASSWMQARADQMASSYSRRRSGFSESFHTAYIAHGSSADIPTVSTGSLFSYGSDAFEQALGSTLTLTLGDHSLGVSESAIYPAASTGRYYCIVRDAAGREAVSDEVEVTAGLYIAQQPQNLNLKSGNTDLTCVPAGGSGEYVMFWYMNGTELPWRGESVDVSQTGPGDYYAEVLDVGTRERVSSIHAMVYESEPLTVTAEQDTYVVDDPEHVELEILFTTSGGVGPYQVEFTHSGETLQSFTMSMESESFVTDTRTVYEEGRYFYVVTDSMGAFQVVEVWVGSEPLRITKQPVGGEIPREGTDPHALLEVVVKGGTPPYVYALYRDGVYDHESNPSNTSNHGFLVREPGVYYILVTDATGNQDESDHVVVTQDLGTEPIIIQQPQSVTVEYREDGNYGSRISCQAISPRTGDDSTLEYLWDAYLPNYSTWAPVYRGSSMPISSALMGYSMRCQVVDTETGEYVYSDIVTATMNLTCTQATDQRGNYDNHYFVFSFEGGVAPYTVKVYQTGVTTSITAMYATFTKDSLSEPIREQWPWTRDILTEVNGEYRYSWEYVSYYLVVTDANGQTVQTDSVRYGDGW